jgi:hypothetical protein
MAIEVPQEGRPPEGIDAFEALVGVDGNAYVVLGTVVKLLRRAGASPEYVAAFQGEATSGDYDHLLATAVAYLDPLP